MNYNENDKDFNYHYQFDWNTNLSYDEENNNDIEYEPLISKEDLDIVAHAFCMRKSETERVSYPKTVEDESLFYECKSEPSKVVYVKVHIIRSSGFKSRHPCYWHIISNSNRGNFTFKYQQFTPKHKDMINKKLQQQELKETDPNNYENSLEWCNQPYSTKKGCNKAFHLSINHDVITLHHQELKNVKQHVVDEWLDSMSYDELIRKHKSF